MRKEAEALHAVSFTARSQRESGRWGYSGGQYCTSAGTGNPGPGLEGPMACSVFFVSYSLVPF